MWAEMVHSFTSLGYLMLQVGPDFSFCLMFFPFSNSFLVQNSERPEEYVSNASTHPWGRWLRSLTPTVGTPASAQVLLHSGPCLHNCHLATLSCLRGPLRSGADDEVVLFLRVSSVTPTLLSALFIYRTSLLSVMFQSLSFPLYHLCHFSHLFPATLPWFHSQVLWSAPLPHPQADEFYSTALDKTHRAIFFSKPLLQVSVHEIPICNFNKRSSPWSQSLKQL